MSGWTRCTILVLTGVALCSVAAAGPRWEDAKKTTRKGPLTDDRDVWGNAGYIVRNPGVPETTPRTPRLSKRVMLEGELEAAKLQLQDALSKASAEEQRRKELESELAEIRTQLEAFKKGTTTPGTATRSYTVKKGDTLWEIAEAMYGSGLQWPKIYNANKGKLSDPNSIRVGQELVIP